jgi:hypothetical protein
MNFLRSMQSIFIALRTVVLDDGRTRSPHRTRIDGVEKPMTAKRLETMFADLTDGIFATAAIRRVMDEC